MSFGFNKFGGTVETTPFNYSLNTTYLIVMKYTFIDGTDNDEVSLFVFEDPELPSTEPISPAIGPLNSGDDITELDRVVLRQAATGNILTIDGIRIGLAWNDGAPLPVELLSFTHSMHRR